MVINIKGTNIKLSKDLRGYIVEKFSALERFFPNSDPDAIIAQVEIGRPSRHHKKGDVYLCEITLEVGGEVLRAAERRTRPQEAIDVVHNEIERRVRKLKSKRRAKFLRGARTAARRMKIFRFFKKDR